MMMTIYINATFRGQRCGTTSIRAVRRQRIKWGWLISGLMEWDVLGVVERIFGSQTDRVIMKGNCHPFYTAEIVLWFFYWFCCCKLIAMFMPICCSNRSRTFRGYGARTHTHTYTHTHTCARCWLQKQRASLAQTIWLCHTRPPAEALCDVVWQNWVRFRHRSVMPSHTKLWTCEVRGEQVSTSGRWSGMSSRSAAADSATCGLRGCFVLSVTQWNCDSTHPWPRQLHAPATWPLEPAAGGSRDSVVSLRRLAYELDGRASNPDRDKRLFSSPNRPDPLWGQSSLLINGCRDSFPGLNRPGRYIDHLPPFSVEVQKEFSCLCIPPVHFHGANSDSFTFSGKLPSARWTGGWMASQPLWAFWRTAKSLAPVRRRTTILRSSGPWPRHGTELSRHPALVIPHLICNAFRIYASLPRFVEEITAGGKECVSVH